MAEDASSEEDGDHGPRLDRNIDEPADAPRPAAVTFATTEHFTLQVARGSTIAESTGRATMFLGAVSGGLIALGLIATASRVGTAFYAFGLVLLPTLTFTGLVTFERVLQSGIEDLRYARRIALLRGYYLDEAPELSPYLLSVLEQRQTDLPQPPPDAGVKQDRLQVQGLGGAWQGFRTVAGMVAVITSVLAGSAVGLLTAIVSDHSLPAALAAGGATAVAALAALMRYQTSAWQRSASMPTMSDQGETPASAPHSS